MLFYYFIVLKCFRNVTALKNTTYSIIFNNINSIQDGSFRACSRIGGEPPSLKSVTHMCTIIKRRTAIPYLKKTQKMYK